MSTYRIQAIEYGEENGLASVCAVDAQTVYESPDHTDLDIEEAEEIAARLDGQISDDVIEHKWCLLSI